MMAEQPYFCGKPITIDEHIAAQEESTQPKLRELRKTQIWRHKWNEIF